MKPIYGLLLAFQLQACGTSDSDYQPAVSEFKEQATGKVAAENQIQQPHRVTVLDLIQVENYTYLKVKEGENEIWIAAPKIEANKGDILYYSSGMLMTNFESKELNRTFDKILFVDKVARDPSALAAGNDIPETNKGIPEQSHPANLSKTATGTSKDPVKQDIRIEAAVKGITIATLLKNPKSYEGKKAMIRGKVTKYTGGVMGKNWVHIQDGTSYNGKFEIVITTLAELNYGDTATFEGNITLNKDLGFGYFFEVLMEDATVSK